MKIYYYAIGAAMLAKLLWMGIMVLRASRQPDPLRRPLNEH